MDMKKMALMGLLVSLAATFSTAVDVNWTQLQVIIEGALPIFGTILLIVVAIIPVLIVLAFAQFIVGLFAGLLTAIKSRI